MTYFPTVENGGLPTAGLTVTSERYTAAALRGIYVCGKCGVLVANDDRHDEWHDNNRHAELAALVSELTIAVEALERKVTVLVSEADLAATYALEANDRGVL